MKVWIVLLNDKRYGVIEGTEIIGVYATEELARAALMKKEWPPLGRGLGLVDELVIETWEVQGQPPAQHITNMAILGGE